jgi:hypothetical protein
MKDGFWLDFVPGVVIVFTTLLALFAGITGATIEGFLVERRNKVKNAA